MKDLNQAAITKHLPIVTIHPDQAMATVKQGVKEGREWIIREQIAYLNTGKRYPLEFKVIIDKDNSPYPAGNYLLSSCSFGSGDFNSLRFDTRNLVLIPLDEPKKA
ncbi:single-stranded DNA-binding protein (plasmid) [Orbus wheelerorum]|uniref:single-stranded DNA-binding protein n=1 Tax=Orbus wheelerorum TaxID=3074111 RepID=UPI00370D0FFF